MVETVESAKQWYVLHTYSGYENKVREDLEMRITSMGMEDYIFRAVVPETEHVEETKTGKQKVVKDKIFPGYVFVEMIMSDEAWFVVRNTPNVTGFLGSHGQGSKPTPLLDDEVHRLLRSQGEVVKRDIHFEVGEMVRVIDGAFDGLEGRIESIAEDQEKLKVVVEMFGRETVAEVEFDQVDKL
ncbi:MULTISPECIES: transcription termination/antitermination protein NusG [Aerococcus]|uniref:Transcription termination/antitermination protein NusG n=1 Tax=Aerococcus sanguinicola TaxID=119206 RepID=A0A5N1GFD4_9LACT|nr:MULTISPECIES: transcription termination/antitermination protein NusG [Aerococcus]KAA9299635.1 transcription termination/antitermination protein NusG [Aerococcus sanguinicola]MDK6369976.1 transcription termination/antitermination protein NusG [Aerococcus sp. UMB9870]MDK6680550.1 transcription termination/antitermination protein NusG [Aerococcus sp. UMB8608]MDK6687380.1 transcription termination/antitermination protein NusG [Aerococcus sp. UMB8623]MDK6805748.1 transcription termination/antite